MLTYAPAREQDYGVFLQLMREHAAPYLEGAMRMLGMDWDQFSELFRSLGEVRAIVQDGTQVGFCWIERRDRTLHIHGLVLGPSFRGQGIGTQVLTDLEREHSGGVDALELGVHASNEGARALYERLGYRTIRTLNGVGFLIMQKDLAPPDDI
jgi:ribosomal protein S18 acetylase RimI-like enzyme